MKRPRLALLAAVLLGIPLPSWSAELGALLKSFSGHVAVLPAPGLGDWAATAMGRALTEAGAAPHLCYLSRDQLVDTNFFTAQHFPVALHLGFESYFQTVHRSGDGDAALRNYLAGGGTLLVLPSGPYPMYYNEAGKPANGAAVVGITIGAGGFENPPSALKMSFRVNTNQSIIRWPEATFAFPAPYEADQRWRPSRPTGNADLRYTPLAALVDDKGNNHGDGAVLLEHAQGPLRGGRVVYVWCSLLATESRRAAVIYELLRWAVAGKSASTSWLQDNFDSRAGVTDNGVIWNLAAGQWKLEQGALVGQDCIADTYEVKGAARGNQAWRDYVFSVRFQVESRASDWRDGAWFGVRCRPDGDGYYVHLTGHDCQVHKVLYGLSTSEANPLTRAACKPDAAWHTLRITAQANRLKGELDGQPLFDVKDDAHLSLPSLRSGGIVLAARKASRSTGSTVVRFDDVAVELMEK